MDASGIVGAVMIIGSAFVYELINRRGKNHDEVEALDNATEAD